MRYFVRLVAILLTSVNLLLCSCSQYSGAPSGFEAGVTLTPELLEEISAKVFGTDADTDAYITVDGDTECFRTKGSDVYHLFRDCRYLKNAKEIIEGTVADAEKDGCERICSACKKQTVTDETD